MPKKQYHFYVYGISLAYGAQYKELYWEIFCEILLLNSIGTIIGIVIGYLVTYYVDFGIMISVVNVQGSWYTFLSAYGLCVVLSSFVAYLSVQKDSLWFENFLYQDFLLAHLQAISVVY